MQLGKLIPAIACAPASRRTRQASMRCMNARSGNSAAEVNTETQMEGWTEAKDLLCMNLRHPQPDFALLLPIAGLQPVVIEREHAARGGPDARLTCTGFFLNAPKVMGKLCFVHGLVHRDQGKND